MNKSQTPETDKKALGNFKRCFHPTGVPYDERVVSAEFARTLELSRNQWMQVAELLFTTSTRTWGVLAKVDIYGVADHQLELNNSAFWLQDAFAAYLHQLEKEKRPDFQDDLAAERGVEKSHSPKPRAI